MHVVGSKIAGPHVSTSAAQAELHANWNKIAQHAAVHLWFAKRMLDAGTTSESAGEINVRTARLDFDSGAPGSRENAPPIRVGAGEHGLHQGGSGNRGGYLSCGIVACRSANFYFNYARGALAVCNDLQCQRMTDVFERTHKA